MFGRKRSLHVCLESTKDKGFENFVELRNELILFVVILNIEIEPFIKLFRAFKDLQRHMARKLVENRIESNRFEKSEEQRKPLFTYIRDEKV
jgi:hypothetical protein